MKAKLILLLCFILSSPAFAQTERVKELYNTGIELMDKGEYDASIEKLTEALSMDPNNAGIHYEIGLAHYLKGDYKMALEATNKITKSKKVFDQIYQLRGNSYDMLGNWEKAIKTYEEGLKKFPNSGPLYLESGVVMLKGQQEQKALTYFEKGIAVAPLHPSNYYWAAKLFLGSSEEEVWGMLYGELFRMLEPNSERSTEISKMLYDTYKSEIKFTSDTTISVSFSKNNVINFSKKQSSFSLPFGMLSYEPVLAMSVAGTKQIDLNSLHQIRSNFVENFYKQEINKKFDNIVFKWHQTLLDQNHFEAYNYWLLKAGNPDEFDAWMEENEPKFDAFVEWFNQNGQPISEKATFHRSQLDSATLTTGE